MKPTPITRILRNDTVIPNAKNLMNGLQLLNSINDSVITAVCFDPQYRGMMDKLKYGNESNARQKARFALPQMSDEAIHTWMTEVERILVPSGHVFLWVDKFYVCEGISQWIDGTGLSIVDMVTWDKGRIGLGCRTRRKCEYLLVLQKPPRRAKGIWMRHDIPDVWTEKIQERVHTHQKPIGLQTALISAVSAKDDHIVDPCAGSYSVLSACQQLSRNFIGGDIATKREL